MVTLENTGASRTITLAVLALSLIGFLFVAGCSNSENKDNPAYDNEGGEM